MKIRDDMGLWIVSAIRDHGGSASVLDVAKHIWSNHQKELEQSGDYFYKWQYDMRWVAQNLRDSGSLKKTTTADRNWSLAQ